MHPAGATKRGRHAAQAGRHALLAFLLVVPIMIAAPASGQTPDPDAPPPADRIDPDCYTETVLSTDPWIVEHPELVEQPDGVCPPGEESEPLPSGPDRERDPSPPADHGPEPSRPGGGADALPAPDASMGVPQAPSGFPAAPEGARTPDARVRRAPDRPGRTKERLGRPAGDGPAAERRRDASGGGAYPEPEDTRRRGARARNGGGAELGDAGFAESSPGPTSAAGVASFVMRGSTVPRFLRGIYQAAQDRYGVRWEILAAINEIETYYGRNLNVSSAGAVGWMQFMPGSWHAYGTDANGDAVKDPYDPEDAIFSAARYLKASGYEHDVRAALFAYNHAGWYVDDVLARARRIAAENVSLPAARRLDAAFAARLMRITDRAGVPWELTLAVLRVRGRDGAVPATTAELRMLARRLVRLGARTDPRGAVRRLAQAKPSGLELGPRLLKREPTFVERVVALAHYNKVVGRVGLVRGLDAVRADLARRVLASPRLAIYPGGRVDIGKGATDVRVLLLLSYLSSRYREVTVTSLTTGHSLFTAAGNVSAHSYGRAVDIAALDGTPILGNQAPGGLTEHALWRMLLLPAELEPSELISLFALGGPSFALEDHADHIHAGY
jgi:Transglycosylase SLT domain